MRAKEAFLFFLGKRKEEVPFDFRPSVSVLIPAYNEEATIGETIKSILNQSYPITEIIVVDDSSTDKTGEIARNFGVKVITTPKNTGTKSRAVNFGLNFVNTEVVVVVDADTVLEKRAIELAIPFLADGNTLSVSGFVLPQEVRTFWERARLIQYLHFITLHKTAQNHWRVPIVSSGCFSLFNTKLLKEMGKFPERTIVEDMDLTWKAHLKKINIKFVPEAVCYSKDPENWRQYKAQMMRWNRGFLQCIAQYKLSLVKNPRLCFFVSWYLLSALLQPFLWAFFLWYLVWFFLVRSPEVFFFLAFWGLFLEGAIVFFTIFLASLKHKCLKKALLNFPFYWLISPIDSYLFFNALIQEWVLGRKLQKWEKGH